MEPPPPAIAPARQQRRVLFARPPLVEGPARAASPPLRALVALVTDHGPAQTSTPAIAADAAASPVEGLPIEPPSIEPPSIEAPLPDRAPPSPPAIYVPRGVRELGYVP